MLGDCILHSERSLEKHNHLCSILKLLELILGPSKSRLTRFLAEQWFQALPGASTTRNPIKALMQLQNRLNRFFDLPKIGWTDFWPHSGSKPCLGPPQLPITTQCSTESENCLNQFLDLLKIGWSNFWLHSGYKPCLGPPPLWIPFNCRHWIQKSLEPILGPSENRLNRHLAARWWEMHDFTRDSIWFTMVISMSRTQARQKAGLRHAPKALLRSFCEVVF